MKHTKTHRMCEACWFHEHAGTMPRIKPGVSLVTCCFCGDPTVAGVVIDVKPDRVTFEFCVKNNERLIA
jgi:hypothetical protein